MNPIPEISIGLPVFNGCDSLEQAIQSLLGQSFQNLELIISDNASIDDTETICRKYAIIDGRIRYIRQQHNIGAVKNFKYVFDLASAELFMWASHDDLWHPLFIEKNICNLSKNPKAVASISQTKLDGETYDEEAAGTKPLTGTFKDRLFSFLNNPGANSRYYSVFRTSALREINLDDEYLARDWSIIVDVIVKGEMLTLENYAGFDKSLSGSGSSMSRFKNSRRHWLEWLFPYIRFSTHVLRITFDPRVILRLAILNMAANKSRMRHYLRAQNNQ